MIILTFVIEKSDRTVVRLYVLLLKQICDDYFCVNFLTVCQPVNLRHHWLEEKIEFGCLQLAILRVKLITVNCTFKAKKGQFRPKLAGWPKFDLS